MLIVTAWQVWGKPALMLLLYFFNWKLQPEFRERRLPHNTSVNGSCRLFIKMLSTYLLRTLTLPLLVVKKRKLDDAINHESINQNESQTTPHRLPALTPGSKAVDEFYEELSECGTKPAILSLVDKYSPSYVPKSFLDKIPQPLPLLYQPEHMELEYHKLLKECESVKIQISEEMALAVEKETRSQSKSKLWFKFRAGRVTASRMKAVCHTDSSNPSQA